MSVLVDLALRALREAAQAQPTPTLRQFAEAAVRAVLAPASAAPTATELDEHLTALESGLAIIKCDCERSPTIAYSHTKACGADLRARKMKDPTAGPPVKVG